jgi:ACS family glucarate transporter-like MFS transporter
MSASVHSARFVARQAVVVLLMFAFSVMSYFDRTIMSIAGPTMMKEFSLTPTQMGTVYSAFVLSYALLMIPGGRLVDILGPRVTLFLMGLGAGILTALTAASSKAALGAVVGALPALLFVRLSLGAVTAPLYPACARMSRNWIPFIYQGRVQGVIIGGSSFGAALSPVIFTHLMQSYGWEISFIVAGLFTAAGALFWVATVTDYPSKRQLTMTSTVPRPALLWNRNLLLITFTYLTLGYYEGIFFYWIYYYFGQVRKIDATSSAKATTVLFLAMGIMMPLGGWVSDRLTQRFGPSVGRRLVPISALALCGTLLIAGTLMTGTAAAIGTLSLAIGFAACCEGPLWAAVIETSGESVGVASGVLNTGGNAGGFLGPLVTPWVASLAGWSWGLYTGTIMIIFGIIACWFFNPTPSRQE